jgi:MOSC domain-containing protein YiiM
LLAVGTAVLRVSAEPNDGCVKWNVRCGPAALAWVTRADHLPLRLRGLFCSVEEDGEVRLGDRLRKV